jgi:hypothetical protein
VAAPFTGASLRLFISPAALAPGAVGKRQSDVFSPLQGGFCTPASAFLPSLSMALKKSPKMADKIPHFSGLKSPHGREKMAILWP